MTNNLNSELRLARRITAVGSGVLHALAALSLLGEALHCAIVLRAELPGTWGDPLFEVLLVISQLAAIGAIVLAARFLRHFCVDPSPFSAAQSARLAVMATIVMGRTVLDVVLSRAFYPVGHAPLPLLCLAVETQVVLKVLALAVFIGCLAMVVRYGNALKEDSDSIV